MYQIFKFFSNNKNLLLFILLESIAVVLIVQNHSYQQSKFFTLSKNIDRSIQAKNSSIRNYFHLKTINESLVSENTSLKNEIERLKNQQTDSVIEITDSAARFQYIEARVIKNSFLNKKNLLTLDKGSLDGVKPNMGVVTKNGIVGITLRVSKHFTVVMSMLHSQMSVNAKLKKNEHFGSLQWDGKDYRYAQLYDIPIQAQVQKGDTIISGRHSEIFPENIPVGVISEIEISNKNFDKIQVAFFTDYSALNNVYLVNYILQEEQLQLENQKNE